MKKKIFFVLSSFSAGGAERVFWLLCQYFDKSKFEIVVILLNTKRNGFSLNLPGVKIIDLKTMKASLSLIPLVKLIKKETPFAIYATGGHINLLVAVASVFCNVPRLIARGTNIPSERIKYGNFKSRLLSKIGLSLLNRFDVIVCQSKEMLDSWSSSRIIDNKKLVIIANPVLESQYINSLDHLAPEKSLIIVARLSSVKGHDRLLTILSELPSQYRLTISGSDGGVQDLVDKQIGQLNLKHRVVRTGQISDVCKVISQHMILVLSSYTEAFPNVVLEALSVGTPVVTFRVGAVSNFIVNGFNGYIVEQGDNEGFKNSIVAACNKSWDHAAISRDVVNRFSVKKIVKQYEHLVIKQ
jgi:glycosyltransferase involved in cell wall biosynthesis